MEIPNDPYAVPVVAPHEVSPPQDKETSDNFRMTSEQNDSPTATGIDPSKNVLSASDLVKILEITLAEMRATQRSAFSVLAFSLAAGAILLKMQDPPRSLLRHDVVTLVCWGLGVVLCAYGAGRIAYLRSYQSPLEDFIMAAEPGKEKVVLNHLSKALHDANILVRRSHWSKWPILIGIIFVVISIFFEVGIFMQK